MLLGNIPQQTTYNLLSAHIVVTFRENLVIVSICKNYLELHIKWSWVLVTDNYK